MNETPPTTASRIVRWSTWFSALRSCWFHTASTKCWMKWIWLDLRLRSCWLCSKTSRIASRWSSSSASQAIMNNGHACWHVIVLVNSSIPSLTSRLWRTSVPETPWTARLTYIMHASRWRSETIVFRSIGVADCTWIGPWSPTALEMFSSSTFVHSNSALAWFISEGLWAIASLHVCTTSWSTSIGQPMSFSTCRSIRWCQRTCKRLPFTFEPLPSMALGDLAIGGKPQPS